MRREYPDRPIVAIGIAIRQEDRILLVRRDKEPARGLWAFPGGALELGESLHEAARREALEETGLEVDVGELLVVVDSIVPDERGRVQFHYVIVDYLAHPAGGSLRPGSDVSDARWVSLADIERLEMTETARQLARTLLAGPQSLPLNCPSPNA